MLVPDQYNIDLGKLRFGSPHAFSYHIVNKGSEVVKISKIVVGCTSCTKASIRSTIINPGKSGVVEVIYTPGKTGRSKKNIQIIYNTNQNLRLDFTADVK